MRRMLVMLFRRAFHYGRGQGHLLELYVCS